MQCSRLCLLGLTGLLAHQVQAAPTPLWGAIASSYDTLIEAHAISDKTLYETLQEAVGACRKLTKGQDCFAIATVQNGCISWAVDRQGHWGWSQITPVNQSPDALVLLQKKALEHCAKNSDPEPQKCQVVRTICTEDLRANDAARNSVP